MYYLIKQVRIAGKGKETYDILISGDRIEDIKSAITDAPAQCEIIDIPGSFVSAGWMDMLADFCDPGNEQRETVITGSNAAAAGGFTHVCTLPATSPAVDSRAVIDYILRSSTGHVTQIHPYGCLTRNAEGKEMAELYDMLSAGAVAFTDGFHVVGDAGMMQRLLLYLKNNNSLLIQYPENNSLAHNGQMNEGKVSTRLGLQARPDLAEHIQVQRDIEIAKYYDAPIHFSQVSSAKTLELIERAKNDHLKVSCDVSINHLSFTENYLENYDVNYKLLPPLRTEEDRDKLREGLKKGVIDAVTSSHLPWEVEHKMVEFDYAAFGNIGLQTVYPLLQTAFGKQEWLDAITTRPRKVLGLPEVKIEKGAVADLTVFNPDLEWTFDEKTNKSRSRNSPLFQSNLKGKAVAVFHNGKAFINH